MAAVNFFLLLCIAAQAKRLQPAEGVGCQHPHEIAVHTSDDDEEGAIPKQQQALHGVVGNQAPQNLRRRILDLARLLVPPAVESAAGASKRVVAEREEAAPRGTAKHQAGTAPHGDANERERHDSKQHSVNPLIVHGLERILREAPRRWGKDAVLCVLKAALRAHFIKGPVHPHLPHVRKKVCPPPHPLVLDNRALLHLESPVLHGHEDPDLHVLRLQDAPRQRTDARGGGRLAHAAQRRRPLVRPCNPDPCAPQRGCPRATAGAQVRAQLRAPGRGAGAAQRRRLTEPMPCAALRNSVEFSCFSRSLSQVIPRLPPSRPRQACGRALRRASGTDGEATSEWATGAGGWGRGAGASRGGAA